MIKKKCKECGTLLNPYAPEYCDVCHGNYGWWFTCDKHQEVFFRDEVEECPVCKAEKDVKKEAGFDERKSSLKLPAAEYDKFQQGSIKKSVPPVIYKESLKKIRADRSFNEFLIEKTKINTLSVIAFFFFLGLIPTSSLGGNPIMVVFCFLSAIVGFRCWIERMTYKSIIKKKSLENYFISIYLPALFNYIWRSFLFIILIGILIELLAGGTWRGGYGFLAGYLIGMWIIASVFIVDIPFWVKRRLAKLDSTDL